MIDDIACDEGSLILKANEPPPPTVPQNRAVGAQFRFQADSSEKNVQLG